MGFFGEFHQTAESGRGDGDGAGVLAGEELAGFFLAEDGVEDAAQGLCELVVKVVFCIDGDVVFEHEDRVFAALVVLCAAGAFYDDVGDAVTEGWSGAGVAFFHALGEFAVGLFADVVGFGEGFCDDEFGHVNFVLEEVGDGVFDVARSVLTGCMIQKKRMGKRLLLSALDVLVYEDFAKDGFNDVLHETAIVSSHSLNAFAVHFVVLFGRCPVQAGIALFVDE